MRSQANLQVALIIILLSSAELCRGQSVTSPLETSARRATDPDRGDTLPSRISARNPFRSTMGVDLANGAAPSWTDECPIIRAQNSENIGDVSSFSERQRDESVFSLESHPDWNRETSSDRDWVCECGNPSRFRLSEFNIYPTFSYLDDVSATYVEFEFASITDLGPFEMENRTVLNVADLPGTISLGPTNFGETEKAGVRASGFGDVLSGFFFSRKDHHKNWHLGIGPIFTFPWASDDILGSNQYTVGPGAHFSAELGKLTAGFFIWQSWEFSGRDSGKRVNQLFGKPFFLYELNEKWNLIYVPLGLSHSWKAKSGDDWTVPLGGGIRRICDFGDHKLGLQFQAFDYVARKPKDPEWEIRFTIEFLFDE